jgi:hypothetical protein
MGGTIMKNQVIRDIVKNLLAFVVYLIIVILVNYFLGNDLTVWATFMDACFLYGIFFAGDFFSDRKKAKEANDTKEKTE